MVRFCGRINRRSRNIIIVRTPIHFTRTSQFKKHYQQCITHDSKLRELFINSMKVFIEDRTTPDLRDHELTGSMKKLRSFSITKDIRIIYQNTAKGIILLDIGTHKQIYRK